MSAVYFFKVGRYVKIGFSSNPAYRAEHVLTGRRMIVPPDLNFDAPVEFIARFDGCRMRDERNMQLLFGAHWVAGEWFLWSRAFAHQLRTIQFVTHAERLAALRQARASMGIVPGAPVKEEKWGMAVVELQEYCRSVRAEALANHEQVAA